jgi:acyl-CoA thioesterase-1
MARLEHHLASTHRRSAHGNRVGFKFGLRSFAAVICTASLAACAHATAAAQPAAAPVLLVLGDSLSAGYGIPVEQGWVSLLGRRLASQGYGYRVVNASVSGETTAGGLARLPHLLEVHRPRLVLIELGANDGLRGLPVAAMSANLEQLVARAAASGARVLLIGMRIPGNYGPRYGADFEASYAAVARARHAPLVPFLLARIALDEANFQADRLHPVAEAQPALLEAVWPVLLPLLRKGGG